MFAYAAANGSDALTFMSRVKLDWRYAMGISMALYLGFSFLYVLMGRLNADEGWYLYAGQLVFQGKIPYRDFTFTQMPLHPYIFGGPQVLFHPSIYLGRLTSVAFSVANLLAGIWLARTFAGNLGAALAAMLLATFSFGIYYCSIVKTYSLLSFLFTLTSVALTSKLPDAWKLPLAVLLSFLATMLRLSAVLFFLPVVVYALYSTIRNRNRFALIVVSGMTVLLSGAAAVLLGLNGENAVWNLFTIHADQWGDVSTPGKLVRIALMRVPDALAYFDHYVGAGVVLACLVLHDRAVRVKFLDGLKRHPALAATGLGLILFVISHFANGACHLEYFVPVVMSALPLLGVAFAKVYTCVGHATLKAVLRWGMALVMLIPLLRQNVQDLDWSGRQFPIEKIREVAQQVTTRSGTAEKLMVLEAAWIVIESGRPVLPGMTMAQFSYQELSREKAEKLHLVNGDMILGYLRARAAKIVVLTDRDWEIVDAAGRGGAMRAALQEHYELAYSRDGFGQYGKKVYLYQARDAAPPAR